MVFAIHSLIHRVSLSSPRVFCRYTTSCHSFCLSFQLMRATCLVLAVAALASLCLAQDLLFPYMYGLNYTEDEQAAKLGLSGMNHTPTRRSLTAPNLCQPMFARARKNGTG